MPRTTVSAVLALLIAFAASLLAGCNGHYEETPPKVYQPGEVFWSYQHTSVALDSSPLVVNGLAYGGSPYGVYAVNADTGELAWHFKYQVWS